MPCRTRLSAAITPCNNPFRRPWNFPEGSIFAQIDAFVQRCCDLTEASPPAKATDPAGETRVMP